jgi:hypothetical protein
MGSRSFLSMSLVKCSLLLGNALIRRGVHLTPYVTFQCVTIMQINGVELNVTCYYCMKVRYEVCIKVRHCLIF